MPFVIGFLALAMLALGLRGTAPAAGKLLARELTGPTSFAPWFLAIMILGLLGYWRPARPFADAMLGLVIVVVLLVEGNPKTGSGGFFNELNQAFTGAKPIGPSGDSLAAPGALGSTAPPSIGRPNLGAIDLPSGYEASPGSFTSVPQTATLTLA